MTSVSRPLVESIDKTFLTKNFNENDGHLYEYSLDNSAPAPFNFGYPGSDPALYTPVPFKPETLENDPHGEVLKRLFWESLGTEPVQYVLQLRVQSAESLLSAGARSLPQIAQAVGFGDQRPLLRQG